MIPQAPWFFLAALAAAIPVILHMISRQRAKHLPFSTLRFLRVSVEKTRRRRRIQDLLLMLLRAAALILIAIGLSDTKITRLSSLLSRGAPAAVGIVLDNSASMGAIDNGRPRFATAKGAVDQVFNELGPDDPVALFLTAGKAFPKQGQLDASRDAVLQILQQSAVRYEAADVGDLFARIDEARHDLAGSNAANKVVYVIGDLQKHSRSEAAKAAQRATAGSDAAAEERDERARKIPIVVVDCARGPKPDAAIQSLKVKTTLPAAGVEMLATVEVFNAADVSQQRLVELYLDDGQKAADTSPMLNLPANGRVEHTFKPFTFATGGPHRCEARLVGEDGSSLDDRRFFAMQVYQDVPVAVVIPRRQKPESLEDGFYVKQALDSGGRAIRTDVLTPKDLDRELSDYRVIYCVNLRVAPQGGGAETPAGSPNAEDEVLKPDAAERLRKYVEGGGHLVWFCGENVVPDDYNAMDQSGKPPLLPAPLGPRRRAAAASGRDSWRIGYLDETYPATAQLVKPNPVYQSVLVYEHVQVKADRAPDAVVLARLDDNEPLLLHRTFPTRGSTTLFGTAARVDHPSGWTNLPVKGVFAPLLLRLTYDLSGTDQTVRSQPAGLPLVVPFVKEAKPFAVAVKSPGRDAFDEEVNTQSEEGQPGQVFRYTETGTIGFYAIRPRAGSRAEQQELVFAVNAHPSEAEPTKAEPKEFEDRFGASSVLLADDPEDLSNTFHLLHNKSNLWDYFLWAVLTVLVFETFVSNWLSPKPADDQLQGVPPAARRPAGKGHAA